MHQDRSHPKPKAIPLLSSRTSKAASKAGSLSYVSLPGDKTPSTIIQIKSPARGGGFLDRRLLFSATAGSG
jgi:hypothetical protein